MNSGQPPASQSDSAPQPEAVSPDTPEVPRADEQVQAAAETPTSPPSPAPETRENSASGPLARGAGPLAARGLGMAKPSSPAVTQAPQREKSKKKGEGQGSGRPSSPKPMGPKAFRPAGIKAPGEEQAAPAAAPTQATDDDGTSTPAPAKQGGHHQRIQVPNLRQPLSDDLMAQLEAELASADVNSLLSSPPGLEKQNIDLEEGQKISARVLKIDDENVYVSLGGPNEGSISRLQFGEDKELPEVGASVDVVVRGFNREDGLYNLVVPGQALDVSDWEDLEEGTVVEAHVAAANTGGLEATVGNIRGFIPISQIAPYRVEDTAEFVGQRMVCLVTECNPRRRNLVLSRRAILEREREEQRQQQLAAIEPGATLEGTVRSVKDFGAFVDLGGLDGMIHVSRLSWENIKHPSDVLEVGQKVKVKVEKVDKQTGKIALSYRDLLENPWDTVEAVAPVGAVMTGTVSRLANFGAFVKLGAGIEGLVHISEVAGHRVSNVSSMLKEGDEVQVKVLSIERESQRIALSMKQAQTKATTAETKPAEEADEPPRELAVRRKHAGPLKGGVGSETSGNPFGLNL